MRRDRWILYLAAFFRALGIGLLGVLFTLYLASAGLGPGRIGILVALGLAGSSAGILLASFWADRIGRRKVFLFLAALTTLGGLALVLLPGFLLPNFLSAPGFLGLAFVCFFGMVNAMGRDRGPFFTLEQAILPQTTDPTHRTQILAWYNLLLDVGMGLGSLLAGLGFFLRQQFGIGILSSYRWTLLLYAGLGLAALLCYFGLSRRIETHTPMPWGKVSGQSRRIITRISLLFGLDSLAGGFLPAGLIAYWFFRRFGVGEEALAPLFFAAHLANAVSYPLAAWISRRLGLVNTMVFTHIPANLCVIAIPFVPTLAWAIGLYLIRESLVEMDVPTRQSYLMAVVAPEERTLASGVTHLVRSIAWASGPGLAGLAMRQVSLSLPLFIGGSLKTLYDLSLYVSFRNLKPPEER